MSPSAFDEDNAVLEKPADLTADQCDALSIWRGLMENGHPVVISCWKPTKEEIEEISRTGRVWLVVLGTSMPPVQVEGFNPFKGR